MVYYIDIHAIVVLNDDAISSKHNDEEQNDLLLYYLIELLLIVLFCPVEYCFYVPPTFSCPKSEQIHDNDLKLL